MMKYSAVLTFAVAGAGVSALPQGGPIPPSFNGQMFVSDLAINAETLAVRTTFSYSLKADYSGASTAPVCRYSDQKKAAGSVCAAKPALGGFEARDCDSQYSWAIHNGTDDSVKPARRGYVLSMVFNEHSVDAKHGCYFIPDTQFKCRNAHAGGGSAHQTYTGPKNFTIQMLGWDACQYKITK